jgi:hypothetical protein
LAGDDTLLGGAAAALPLAARARHSGHNGELADESPHLRQPALFAA